jgi:hypothetical protein
MHLHLDGAVVLAGMSVLRRLLAANGDSEGDCDK